jgi:valine--pyruvate aminotransferase
MQASLFGQKFLGDSGILSLMDDLGKAASQDGVIMLGGGNPSRIPEVEKLFQRRMERILDSEHDFEDLIGSYDGPAGNQAFVSALADLFREEYGWPVTDDNIALTNGSQTAFFFLFNLFGGRHPGDDNKQILLPLAPEYIGYADAGIGPDLFTARRPQIEHLSDRIYKYHIDFEALQIGPEIGAICVSRPTNPTGNVLTEAEISTLSGLALAHQIPLIIDSAYGIPFPGIIFSDARPVWAPHIVLCMSLSKLGLPGARTGIVLANPDVIKALAGMNAVVSLAPGSFGASLALDAVRSRDILHLSRQVIRPHYEAKAHRTLDWLHESLNGCDYYIRKPEGAFFFWLWFNDLPISCQTLYARLKERGVLVVPGHYFFPGLPEAWPHKTQCIRMSYAGNDDQVQAGIKIIAEEVKRAYGNGSRSSN